MLETRTILIFKGGNIMKEQLQYDQLEELMYMSKSGEITKRRVKVVKMTSEEEVYKIYGEARGELNGQCQ